MRVEPTVSLLVAGFFVGEDVVNLPFTSLEEVAVIRFLVKSVGFGPDIIPRFGAVAEVAAAVREANPGLGAVEDKVDLVVFAAAGALDVVDLVAVGPTPRAAVVVVVRGLGTEGDDDETGFLTGGMVVLEDVAVDGGFVAAVLGAGGRDVAGLASAVRASVRFAAAADGEAVFLSRRVDAGLVTADREDSGTHGATVGFGAAGFLVMGFDVPVTSGFFTPVLAGDLGVVDVLAAGPSGLLNPADFVAGGFVADVANGLVGLVEGTDLEAAGTVEEDPGPGLFAATEELVLLVGALVLEVTPLADDAPINGVVRLPANPGFTSVVRPAGFLAASVGFLANSLVGFLVGPLAAAALDATPLTPSGTVPTAASGRTAAGIASWAASTTDSKRSPLTGSVAVS